MNKNGGFFGGFFRSFTADGGSYNLQIDYDSLPFPCPELAAMAMEQQQTKTVAVTTSPSRPDLQLATFAGGCFWGLELAFQRVEGVEYTAVGYTQGREACPNYEQVSAGNTGHTEAVVVYFDPNVISYSQLCRIFLDRINPTTQNGQGRDYGWQYRTGIYTHSPEQDDIARSLLQQEQSKYDKRPIATECRTAMPFWPAEAYHQQYLETAC
ncbi:peptide methionine sulfoxide reductase [Nitzschia inconspicua]|uniref:Peptide methionine sulfoxide reductase n=1 Tax=Nitzschia inconspicua TaxID=303405 RepID=A0A9K3LW37_9STRA|nr:peptide methionine sulfoxide reductase [Nitzschia inconspicua]